MAWANQPMIWKLLLKKGLIWKLFSVGGFDCNLKNWESNILILHSQFFKLYQNVYKVWVSDWFFSPLRYDPKISKSLSNSKRPPGGINNITTSKKDFSFEIFGVILWKQKSIHHSYNKFKDQNIHSLLIIMFVGYLQGLQYKELSLK